MTTNNYVWEKDLSLNDLVLKQKEEIERLNKQLQLISDEFLKYAYDNEVRPLNDRKVSVWTICLDKLQELKGSDKE